MKKQAKQLTFLVGRVFFVVILGRMGGAYIIATILELIIKYQRECNKIRLNHTAIQNTVSKKTIAQFCFRFVVFVAV